MGYGKQDWAVDQWRYPGWHLEVDGGHWVCIDGYRLVGPFLTEEEAQVEMERRRDALGL